ncbi:MAG TPA: ABC transporter substrate-binding protein [Chloroflexota bacterium]|nr:ABC transporter substrate-binding protein [Chloroflexota bacterium]
MVSSPASASAAAKPSAAASAAAKPAASSAAAKPAGNAAHVKLGYNPILAGAAMYFAQDRGYFAEQNVEVEFIPFDSGALMNAPLSAGQLDAIPATPSPGLFNALSRDVTLKAVAANNLTNATLVVRKDLADSGQVKTVADLKGKKVSLNVEGSPVDYGIRNILYKSGLTLKDIDLQRVVNTDTAAALSNKALDAGSASEPLSTQIIQKGIAVKLANSADYIGNQTASFIAFGPSFLNRTDDVPVRFIRAYLKGFADYATAAKDGKITNQADLAIISKWTKVPAETIASSPIVPPPTDSRVDLADLQRQQDFWQKEGIVKNPVDLSKFVEYKYVDAAKAA